MLNTILKGFERVIVFALLAMLSAVILLTTIDVGRQIVMQVLAAPMFILEADQLLEIFGLILLILIGVELVETIKAYFVEHVVHVEVVIEVALIAVARKVIILDVKTLEPMLLFAIAALVIALSAGYYLEKRGRTHV